MGARSDLNQEFIASTDPRDVISRLEIDHVQCLPDGLEISWSAVIGKRYAVIAGDARFSNTWELVDTVVASKEEMVHPVRYDGKARFYRVAVVR